MRFRNGLFVLLGCLLVTPMMKATPVATLDAGHELDITFTSTTSTANMLVLYSLNAVSVTGTPVVTASLYDGTTLLGGGPGALFVYSGSTYLQFYIKSPSNPYGSGGTGTVYTADLTTFDSGTINGLLTITVSGGTVALNPAGITLLSARNTSSTGYSQTAGIQNQIFTVNSTEQVSATPEPSSLVLLGTGAAGAAGAFRRRFVRA